jgi:hypothetical protein
MPAADQQGLYIKGNARRMDLRIGAVLPDGAEVAWATLNGSPVKPKLVKSVPGLEASVLRQARAAYGHFGDQRRQLMRPVLRSGSGDHGTAQDHVSRRAQDAEIETRIGVEDHQIGGRPFAEP